MIPDFHDSFYSNYFEKKKAPSFKKYNDTIEPYERKKHSFRVSFEFYYNMPEIKRTKTLEVEACSAEEAKQYIHLHYPNVSSIEFL